MILYILSSPTLVSSLMVVRAKNSVHSILFLIPVFRNTLCLLILLGLDLFALLQGLSLIVVSTPYYWTTNLTIVHYL